MAESNNAPALYSPAQTAVAPAALSDAEVLYGKDVAVDAGKAMISQAPARYDLKIPAGVIVDQPLLAEFYALAKQDGLSNARLQKYADLQIKSIGVFAQKQAEVIEAKKVDWFNELAADPAIGGAKLSATMTLAQGAFNHLVATTPGVDGRRLKMDLQRTALEAHPDLVRMFHHMGEILSGRSAAGGRKSDAEVLYRG